MKLKSLLITGLAVIFLSISCKDNSKNNSKENTSTNKTEASYKTANIQIEGMTCEIGCAKTIESKLSKTEGITSSKVNFEEKTGQFTFDENAISKEELVKKINAIGGGELYTATITSVTDGKTACKAKTACCSADGKTCTMKCSETCTVKDCEKCAAKQEECKTKCATEKMACCTADKKDCAVKCSDNCTVKDCEKCAAKKAACKTKCTAEQKASCTATKK